MKCRTCVCVCVRAPQPAVRPYFDQKCVRARAIAAAAVVGGVFLFGRLRRADGPLCFLRHRANAPAREFWKPISINIFRSAGWHCVYVCVCWVRLVRKKRYTFECAEFSRIQIHQHESTVRQTAKGQLKETIYNGVVMGRRGATHTHTHT